ncbi:MAG TPA: sodium:proton exchanger, partial [Sulfitobacter sp.]|nr:sodium:proton exchanger [Sulfitobacter sp.]
MATETLGALNPVTAIALVGAIGVGSQWIAWRLRMPAIVLMLVAGILIGPVLGIFDPARDIGPLMGPMISIAVAIILFEGGLSLNFHTLQDAVGGVRRLVYIGAPLGWLMSALSLHYVAGLSWSSSAVFGGIMIVTGPTVIAPLLRTARLSRRPATLLQWEAILNDP